MVDTNDNNSFKNIISYKCLIMLIKNKHSNKVDEIK